MPGVAVKGLIIFGSSRGNTRTVVRRVPPMLNFPVEVVDVKDVGQTGIPTEYDLFLFFASTWGDGELQADMENFLIGQSLNIPGKLYAICELGNYYGYDDFEFGAMRIIRHFLENGGGIEIIEPFSMDSLPRKDWDGLGRWCKLLNDKVKT
jgi:flavodoxin